MKAYIKRAVVVVLTLAVSAVLFGCGVTKKTVTVYNASPLFLTSVQFSNTDDVNNVDAFIPVIDSRNSVVQAGQSGDYTVEIPSDMLDDELYIYVAAADMDTFKPYDALISCGKSVNDGIWGISVDFDKENGKLVVTVLDSSSI